MSQVMSSVWDSLTEKGGFEVGTGPCLAALRMNLGGRRGRRGLPGALSLPAETPAKAARRRGLRAQSVNMLCVLRMSGIRAQTTIKVKAQLVPRMWTQPEITGRSMWLGSGLSLWLE